MGFGFLGLGFGVSSLGRVWMFLHEGNAPSGEAISGEDLRLRLKVSGFGFRVGSLGLGSGVQGLGLRDEASPLSAERYESIKMQRVGQKVPYRPKCKR